jgi:hypothetical protein
LGEEAAPPPEEGRPPGVGPKKNIYLFFCRLLIIYLNREGCIISIFPISSISPSFFTPGEGGAFPSFNPMVPVLYSYLSKKGGFLWVILL